MRISLNWIKRLVRISVPDTELVRRIGARLVEVEDVIDETHKYDRIYIVRVETAEKIPDTHLTKCLINVGDNEIPGVEYTDGLVQVMCGAPNVREGMLAVWIAPGAIVPASVHEDAPFIIGKRKMLGKYDSFGMLAGADELDLGEDHSGIVEIDPDLTVPNGSMPVRPGDKLADFFDLNDKILDIENKSLTHRPDTFGVIGFAREVAGILGERFEEPSPRSFSDDVSEECPLHIDVKDSDICPRYSAVVLKKHGEFGKKYLTLTDTLLAKSGMHPISRVVDATNYLMLETGQPLHAFDYDKFIAVAGTDQPEIVVRLARAGEKLLLLDDREIELTPDDIVICSGDTPVALAGAMGGKSTEIDDTTKNIIIESATFSLYHLRKTQMAHGIFSEAITRFTKGQPSYQTRDVALRCADMLGEGYRVAGVSDYYPTHPEEIVVTVTTHDVNSLLGTALTSEQMVNLLENVGFRVQTEETASEITGKASVKSTSEIAEKNTILRVKVPAWRTDIHIKEDITEEIGRLNGYDNITPVLPLHPTAEPSSEFELKREIRTLLSKFGANELLTYSFVSGRLLANAAQDPANSYQIVNSISPDLQYVRQSIIPSLLDKAYMNEKLPVEKMAIYEMNKVYQKSWGLNEENVPAERTHLGLVIAERKGTGTAYYKAKKYTDGLFQYLNIPVKYIPLQNDLPEASMLEGRRAAEIVSSATGEHIGVIGELKNSVKHSYKLGDYTAAAELDLAPLLTLRTNNSEIKLGQIKSSDETIETTATYAEVLAELQSKYPTATITPLSIYQPTDSSTKKITFHIETRK
ncbi:phenylalanine--tRNA ligase subunit beta [Candidatus Saccharibacteria bacterium]|nr:phenylalanine--tRNA ligase subunit beta [Candidatus Saccharibacteria bacterium]